MRDLPRLLWESMGIRLRREYLIGVTGHRPHRLGDSAALENAVIETLETLQSQHADKRMVLMSPLAEGSDRCKNRDGTFRDGAVVPLPLP